MRRARITEPAADAAHDLEAKLAAAIEQALGAVDDTEFDLRLLGPIVARAGIDQREVVQKAREGRFAPVFPLSQRTILVRAQDLRDWMQSVEVSARRAPDPRNLDLTPAEPFAHLREKKPAPLSAQRAEQGRRSARTRAQSSTRTLSINDAARTLQADKLESARAGTDNSPREGGRRGCS